MNLQLARRAITIAEYHQMIEAGILKEDERLELLDGEIIERCPIGPRHSACVDRLTLFLVRLLGTAAIVRVQSSIQLSDTSEPQPDLALLKPRADFYAQALPLPADVLAAIEVADTTADQDRAFKLPTYARAGIAEAWLVDLINDRIEIYAQPNRGVYQEIRLVLRDQTVVSQTFPQLALPANDILG